MKKTASFAAAALIALPMAAHAVLVSYGTSELVSIRDCIAGASGCDDIVSRAVALVYGGTPGAATSSASVSLAGYGSATGTVSLSGTIGAPILNAFATSDPGRRTNTNSAALQSYTYTGAAQTTRTFGGALTYSQSLTGTYPFGVGAGVYALIDVFTLPTSTIDVGTSAVSNFNALSGVFFGLPGYTDLGFAQYSDTSSTVSGSGTLGVTVTLNPGDTVWVWAYLQTSAPNGSTVDASHTLITSWDNSANLIPAVSVPEPGTLTLLGISLAGLLVAPRRNWRSD